MALTFSEVQISDTLRFVNTHSNGRTSTHSTHTGQVTKITEKMIFLDAPTADGHRPVRYRIARSTWDNRQVTRITTTGLPRRGNNNASRIAAAQIRPTQGTPTSERVGHLGDCTVSYHPDQKAAPWTLTAPSGERTYCPTDGLTTILTTEHGHPELEVTQLMAELSA